MFTIFAREKSRLKSGAFFETLRLREENSGYDYKDKFVKRFLRLILRN